MKVGIVLGGGGQGGRRTLVSSNNLGEERVNEKWLGKGEGYKASGR